MGRVAKLKTLCLLLSAYFYLTLGVQAESTSDVPATVPVISEPAEISPRPDDGVISHVVVVLDATESMYWPNHPGHPSRLSLAKKAANLVVDLVPVDTLLTVLVLQDDVSAVRPLSPLQAADRHGIHDSIEVLKPSGHGELAACFDEVERVLTGGADDSGPVSLPSNTQPLVVIITDGNDCDPGVAHGQATQLNSRFKTGMKFSLIGVCTHESIAAPLRSLATSGSGWYSQLESDTGLETAFSRTRDCCNGIRNHRAEQQRLLEQSLIETIADRDRLQTLLNVNQSQLAMCLEDGQTKDNTIVALQKALSDLSTKHLLLSKDLETAQGRIRELSDDKKILGTKLDGVSQSLVNETKRANDEATRKVEVSTLLSERNNEAADLRSRNKQLNEQNKTLDKSVTTEFAEIRKKMGAIDGVVSGINDILKGKWENLIGSSVMGMIPVLLLIVMQTIFKNPLFKTFISSIVSDETKKITAKLEALETHVDGTSDAMTAKVDSTIAKGDQIEKAVTAVHSTLEQTVVARIDVVGNAVSETRNAITETRNDVKQSVGAVNAIQTNARDAVLAKIDANAIADTAATKEIREALTTSERTIEAGCQKTAAKIGEKVEAVLTKIDANAIADTAATKQIREALTTSERTIEAGCQKTAAKIAEKVDAVSASVSKSSCDTKEAINEGVEKLVQEINDTRTTFTGETSGLAKSVAGSVGELQADVRKIEADVHHISDAVTPISTSVTETRADVQSTSRDIRIDLETKLNQLNREFTGKIEAESRGLESGLRESFVRAVNDGTTTVNDHTTEFVGGGLESIRSQLKECCDGTSRKLKKLHAETNTGFETMTGNCLEARRELSQQKEDLTSLLRSLQAPLMEGVSSIRADMESLQSAIKQLEDVAEKQQTSLEGQRNANSQNFAEARSRLDQLDGRFGQLAREVAVDVDDLISRQVKDLPREITSEIVTQIEALEQDVRSILETAERQQDQPVSSVKDVVNAVKLLESRITKLDKQVDRLRNGLEKGLKPAAPELQGVEEEDAVQALSEVHGIGKPTAIKLYAEQITTVVALAELPEQRIVEVRPKVRRLEHLIELAKQFLSGEAGGAAMT